MANPSRLTQEQWETIQNRRLVGESDSALGREFGISEAAIRKRFGPKVRSESSKVRKVAETLALANAALAELPPSQRGAAISLADMLGRVSRDLATSALNGARTSAILSGVATKAAERVNPDAPMESQEDLQAVAAVTRMANDAASVGLALIAANRQAPLPGEVVAMASNKITIEYVDSDSAPKLDT